MKFSFENKVKKLAPLVTKWTEHKEMQMARGWVVILFFTSLVFLTGAGLIAFDFYSQFGAPKNEVVSEQQTVSYRDKDVRAYAKLYRERENTFNTLRNKYGRKIIPEPEPVVEEVSEEEDEPSETLADEL